MGRFSSENYSFLWPAISSIFSDTLILEKRPARYCFDLFGYNLDANSFGLKFNWSFINNRVKVASG